jgi:hypothetical protein
MLSLRLADGQWLNAAVDVDGPPLDWAWPASVTLVLTAIAIVIVVFAIVGKIARPWRRLQMQQSGSGVGKAFQISPGTAQPR